MKCSDLCQSTNSLQRTFEIFKEDFAGSLSGRNVNFESLTFYLLFLRMKELEREMDKVIEQSLCMPETEQSRRCFYALVRDRNVLQRCKRIFRIKKIESDRNFWKRISLF